MPHLMLRRSWPTEGYHRHGKYFQSGIPVEVTADELETYQRDIEIGHLLVVTSDGKSVSAPPPPAPAASEEATGDALDALGLDKRTTKNLRDNGLTTPDEVREAQEVWKDWRSAGKISAALQ